MDSSFMDTSMDAWREDMDWGDEDSQVDQVLNELQSSSDNIRVAVRVRPPNKRELAGNGGKVCVTVPGTSAEEGRVSVMGEDFRESKDFTFDYAFSPTTTPLEVFNALGIEIVHFAHHGYNASLFAYGQTSSGKSYSMMGIYGTTEIGLIPRIAHLLFQTINATCNNRACAVEASYMEIYNEKLRDLINEKKSGEVLKVRENVQLGVHVVGLTRETVTSAQDVLGVIEYGTSRRTTAATLYNSESSRSHSVFELKVQSKYNDKTTKKEMHSTSRVALIDLAGSERSEKVHSKGITLVEGNNINKSLTVLGRCIRALYDQSKGKKVIVPFRDSLLTWYLRDTLAGNSRTTMLATCSPVESNMEETLSTLRYASSAKYIKTVAIKNEDPAQAKIRELSLEVDMLKKKLKAAEEVIDASTVDNMSDVSSLSDISELGGSSVSPVKNGGRGGGRGHSIRTGGRSAPPGRGGKGKLVRRGSVMSLSEREHLLNELTRQMDTLSDLSSPSSISSSSTAHTNHRPRVPLPDRKRVANTFPVLSCVNKDELLNHTLKIRIGSVRPFTIGRKISSLHEKDLKKNNFELNGMGIKTRHCEFVQAAAEEFCLEEKLGKMSTSDKSPSKASKSVSSRSIQTNPSSSPSVAIRTLSPDALVYVNGLVVKEGNDIKLKHLDRIVLGPCRLVALYITKPLTPKERELWQYEFCLEEVSRNQIHEMDSDEETVSGYISPARKLIVESLRVVQAEQLAQANVIAHEMGSPFRFNCEMVVRGQNGLAKKKNFTIDDYLELNKPRIYVSCVVDNYQSMKKKAEVKGTEDMLIAINKQVASFSSDEDDMLFDPTESTPATESLVSASTLSGKADSEKYNNQNENVKVLFEIPLHEFEDLLAELKYIHSFYAKLSNGLQELKGASSTSGTVASSEPNISNDNMIRNLFNSQDVNKTGKVSMQGVEETILMFDRYPWFDHEKDPNLFIKYVCTHENISVEAKEIDFEKFAKTLDRFLQFQFNNVLKPYISDKYTFVKFGGVLQEKGGSEDQRTLGEMEKLKMKYEREIAALQEEHKTTMAKVHQLKVSMEDLHLKKTSTSSKHR